MAAEPFINFPNSSDNRGGVISFSGGHVDHHKWLDPRTITAKSSDYHRRDEASAGNRDIYWLRECTTIRR